LYRHLPKLHSEPTPRGPQIFPRAKRLAACAAICQVLAACAIAMPPTSGIDTEPTGAIIPVSARTVSAPGLPASLDDEDRRRALGALAIALDPQGNGATVHWDNPVSKAHGSVTPAGFAYPSNDLICRDFLAQFETTAGPEAARGAACRDKDAQWSLAKLQVAKKD
jgi:surface antigen